MTSQLSPADQKLLLALARATIEDVSAGRQPRSLDAGPGGRQQNRGAFVTLHRRGNLRGCIGNFVGQGDLANTVRQMAVAAASEDPRFSPVRPAEVPEIDIEISVLSPLEEIDDPGKIEVGRHGIYIINPRGRGVLLPQVATEHGWDRQTFLDQTCLKAGLRPGCWQDPATTILVFSAEIFGEKQVAGD